MLKKKLYIIPTPIGNLKDITYRSIYILNKSDLIIVENIYHSLILLKAYNIKKPLIKYNKYNENNKIYNIIKYIKINNSKIISLISNAGYPSISDPGYLLIKTFIKKKFYISCLPGSNAILPSLIVSGFPLNEFMYIGFLTKKNIKKKLNLIKSKKITIVFYDSPKRLLNTLINLNNIIGENRKIIIYKEISKIHEKIIRGKIKNILKKYKNKKIKGELTYVIKGI
ncbi:MAG: 16S rRNA (cytidine(1402)-2'-O)-methyltransferase [Candidatus Shikimatogenerans bostrichidophilus]|nr:MAG: 16S rRNA (cytidine(1402)-2'-O)-methyltransferase [Candidatus Shikimatogenerans bostrichidophilus]